MNPDGEDWRRGYDGWRTNAPDTGAGGWKDKPCAVCGTTTRKPFSRTCAAGHTPEQQDAAAKAERGW